MVLADSALIMKMVMMRFMSMMLVEISGSAIGKGYFQTDKKKLFSRFVGAQTSQFSLAGRFTEIS